MEGRYEGGGHIMGFQDKAIVRDRWVGEARRVLWLRQDHHTHEAIILALLENNPSLSQLIGFVLDKNSALEKPKACQREREANGSLMH